MFSLRYLLNFVFITLVAISISSCSSGGCCTNNTSSTTGGITIGTLPNGSQVWMSESSINVSSNGITTASLYLTAGSSSETYTFTFQVTPTGPELATNPEPCTLTTDLNQSCTLIINANNAALGTYQITTFYTQVNSQTSSTANETTALPTPIIINITNSTPRIGTLVISPFEKNPIGVNQTTHALISLSNSFDVIEPVTVTITNNNENLITLTPPNCSLTTESNSCTVTITGIDSGNASFSIIASGYESSTSTSLAITSSGIMFGNWQGYMYKNNTLLAGESPIFAINIFNITGFVADSQGNLYLSTNGGATTFDLNGIVWKKDYNSNQWTTLSGIGNEGSIDNSIITSITVDQYDNLYASTSNGIVTKYNNTTKQWNTLGNSFITMVNAYPRYIAVINNTVYAALNNGQFYMLNNNTWDLISNSSGGATPSSLTASNESVFVGYDNGEIYVYSNNNWALYNTLNAHPVSLIYSEESNILYASDNINPNNQVYSVTPQSITQIGTATSGRIFSLALSNNQLYLSMVNQVQVYDPDLQVWQEVGGELGFVGVNSDVVSLINNPLNNQLYAAVHELSSINSAYHLNTNLDQWEIVGSGTINGSVITGVTKSPSESIFIIMENGLSYQYNESNESFTIIVEDGTNITNTGAVFSIAATTNSLFASGFNEVFIYDPLNKIWIQSQQLYLSNYHAVLLFNNNGRLYATSSFNANSGSGGNVWQQNLTTHQLESIPGAATGNSLDNSSVHSLAFGKTGNLYAGTAYGQVWQLNAESQIWQLTGSGTIDASIITALVVNDQNTLYAGTQKGMVYTYNVLLNTWVSAGIYFDGSDISNLVIDSANTMYATTIAGNIFMHINGSNWVQLKYGNNSYIYSRVAVGL